MNKMLACLRTIHNRKYGSTNSSKPGISWPTIEIYFKFDVIIGHALQHREQAARLAVQGKHTTWKNINRLGKPALSANNIKNKLKRHSYPQINYDACIYIFFFVLIFNQHMFPNHSAKMYF